MSTPQAFFPLVSIGWLGVETLRHRLGRAWSAFTARRRRTDRQRTKLALTTARRPRTPLWAAAFNAAAAHRHGRWD